MTRAASLALVVLLVTAGCLAPTTDTVVPPGERVEGNVSVRGPSPGVDPGPVFGRVRALLDENTSPPSGISVIAPDPSGEASGNDTAGNESVENGSAENDSVGLFGTPPFWSAMGVERDPGGIENVSGIQNGATSGLGQVLLVLGDNDTTAVEYVLAHEFVHYVQFAEGYDRAVGESVAVTTTDGRFAYRATLEGTAVFATDAYIRRFMDTDRRNSDLYPRIAAALAPGSADRYRNARYVLGTRYVAGRIDDPESLPAVYEDPPRTAEQVIHGYPPGAEPPRNLSVTVAGGEYALQGTDRMGEAWLRTALRNGVDRPAADRAAAGWGNDSLLTFRSGAGETAFAWVLRFDDPANRSEFETVFGEYLAARGERSGDLWSVGEWTFDYRSVGRDATAVLVGPEAFVANASVGGSGGNVTVRTPDGDG